jgi:hypothetical protein
LKSEEISSLKRQSTRIIAIDVNQLVKREDLYMNISGFGALKISLVGMM